MKTKLVLGLLFLSLMLSRCSPTGKVTSYNWRTAPSDCFDGKSAYELSNMTGDEIVIKSKRIQDYFDFFDYPGSRDKKAKAYFYTGSRQVKRDLRPGSGINFGNTFDAPSEGEWGIVLEESDFRTVRDAGFQILRLPVRFQAHVVSTEPFGLDPVFMERIDWALDQAMKNDLIVILDFHHYLSNDVFRYSSPEEERESAEMFLSIWSLVARRYRDYPGTLWFELMNEPHLPYSNSLWNTVSREAISVIRSTGGNNADRTLVVGCGTWSHIGALEELEIPTVAEDPNLLVTFHYYEPISFTHQGANWGALAKLAGQWKGNVWTGTEYQKKLVREDLDQAAAWGRKHGRKLLLGEFGVRADADRDSRADYIRYVREQAEERGILWTFWDFDAADSTGIHDDTLGWKMEILDALIPGGE